MIYIRGGNDIHHIIFSGSDIGFWCGMGAVFGIITGLSVWGIGTIFGVSAIISASKTAFTVIEWAGALYLVYLSIRLISQSIRGLSVKEAAEASEAETKTDLKTPDSFREGFKRGSLTTLLNPLVGVFDMTAFPNFIPSDHNAITYSFILVISQLVTTFLWYSALAGMALSLGRFFSNPKTIRILDMITGIFFFFFAVKLVLN
ncbi:LysE family translocator [Zymomonas mobilis]|nr:LysE family translocator [Zymomonas mobilis]